MRNRRNIRVGACNEWHIGGRGKSSKKRKINRWIPLSSSGVSQNVSGNILTRGNGSSCDRCPFPRDYNVNCSLRSRRTCIDCGSPRFILTEARRLTANQSGANICPFLQFLGCSTTFHDPSRR